MGAGHDLAPEPRRQSAAGHPVHWPVVVIAEPDARRVVRRVAKEPGIAAILAGAGLAARLPSKIRRPAGAITDHR